MHLPNLMRKKVQNGTSDVIYGKFESGQIDTLLLIDMKVIKWFFLYIKGGDVQRIKTPIAITISKELGDGTKG